MTRPASSRAVGPDGIDVAIGVGLGGLLAVGIIQWLIGNLAAMLGRARLLHATPVDAVRSLPGLLKHAGNPAASWPAAVRGNLPGPVPYWIATVVVLTAVTAGALAVITLVGRRRQVPIDKRRRLGVPTQPRLATRRDVAPLFTRRPEPNRFVLARHGRGYLSTEDTSSRGGRRGVAGAVAIFGPSQSGKTTGLIDGVAAWTGPAIISSVKADLLRATIDRRRQLGDVRIFDPLGVTGHPSATWSPLRPAKSLTGALTAAGILARTGADDTTPGDKFWRGQAEQLLAAMLFTAANIPDHTMRHVVRWVLDLDRPGDTDGPGTLAPLVRRLTDSNDPQIALSAKQVQGWLHGQWNTDPRTTSSVYATARNAVWPWADPAIATSAESCDLTLDWLLYEANTIYLVAPLGDDRIGLVFAALLHDLISDAFTAYNRQGAPLDPRLLVVCDEAANTPLPKLPQWAATVSGAGIQLATVWQSRAQLDETYGRQADSVLTNHRSKLFYPSGLTDTSTTDYLSVLSGTEHVRADLATGQPFSSPPGQDRGHVATAVPFAPADVLRRLQVGDAYLVHGHLPPTWIPRSTRAQQPDKTPNAHRLE